MAGRTRGMSAGLSREHIVRTAVALVDRDGLDRFGVRRLADELGVDAMSIYHHIKGKAALLDAISEAVLSEVMVPDPDDSSSWEEMTHSALCSYREMAFRHPAVFPLLTTRAQTSAVALTALERLVTAMRESGLPDQVVAEAPMMLFSFVNGYLLAVLSGTPDQVGDLPAIDAASYPTMARLMPLQAGYGSPAEFDRMIGTLIIGIRTRADHSLTDTSPF